MAFFVNIRYVIRSSIFNADNPTGKLPPHSMLQNRYIIVQRVGKGGMGAVYEAIDTHMRNLHVAIKEMSQAHLSSEDRLFYEKRFQDEADILRRLNHPHLPRVYDAFQEHNRSYIVMDFIQGETLLQMLEKCKGDPMPAKQVIHYALQVCDVLTYLHQLTPPIMFLDLKPSNVMIDANAGIFLIDFGIARLLKEDQPTETRNFLSEGYAAPEQYGLTPNGKPLTTTQSDLYSLGATLHHCLTAQRPLGIADHFRFAPLNKYNPHAPKQLDPLIHRLVEHDPKNRPSDALEVKQALLAIQKVLPDSKDQGPLRLSQNHPFGSSLPMNDNVTVGPTKITALPPAGIPDNNGLQWLITIITGIISGLFSTAISALFKSLWNIARSPRSPLPKAMRYFKNARPGSLFASNIWQPGFILLLCTLLIGLLGIGLYSFAISNRSVIFVAFCLSLILVLLTLLIGLSSGILSPLPRNILLIIGASAFISFIILQGDSTVQIGITKILHGIPAGQFFVLAIVISALISLLRAILRWDNWFEWTDRFCALGLIIVCLLLQATVGASERVPFVTKDTFPLATMSLHTFSLNNLVMLGLLLMAILLLYPVRSTLSKQERMLLFLCILVFAWQQLSFGEVEIQTWLPRADQQLVVSINQGVALGIAILGLFLLARYRRQWVHPLLLLGIVIPCMLLQYILAKQFTIPLLSPPGQQSNHTIYQLIVWGLVIAGLVLLVRLRRELHWVDRILIFTIACATALLQYSFGESEVMHMHLSFYDFDQSPFSLLQVIGFNHVLVFALFLAAIVMLIRWTCTEFTAVDRIVLICIPISAAILQFLFGGIEQFTTLKLNIGDRSYSFNFILAGVLVLVAIFALLRMKRPFNGWDRIILIISAASCLLLIMNFTLVQQLPLFSTNIMQSEENALQIAMQYRLVVPLTMLDAVLIFFWLKRPYSQQDRKILKIVFGVALAAAVFQLFIPFLQVVTLSALTLSILIATQMERMHNVGNMKSQLRPWYGV